MNAKPDRRLRFQILLMRCSLELYIAAIVTALFVMDSCT
jgi:hypothetical protein